MRQFGWNSCCCQNVGLTGGRNKTSIILPRSTTAGSIRLLGPCGEATEAWHSAVCLAQDDANNTTFAEANAQVKG